ncbi:hypothetical protein HY990_00290 [Candidatus Micrarchaeota archaeon]|nr:hypothetical protein [Candidatus Micrarchaeota archaeon]
MEYRPTFASFIGSSLYGFSPAITVATAMYFLLEPARWIMWVASGAMLILSLHLTVQTICVHLQKLYVDDYCIRVSGPMLKAVIQWKDVVSAVLRERENLMSRTDHLLIIKSVNHMLSYNTSVLSKEDEKEVLEMVTKMTRLVIQRDKPSI